MERSTGTTSTSQSHSPKSAPSFSKVKDGRKQDIRGLWVRGSRFYAQLTIEDHATGDKSVRRVPLMDKDRKPVGTVAQAVEAMSRLKVSRSDNDLPVLHRCPKFKDFSETYLAWIKVGDGQKAPGTLEKESGQIKGWIGHLGARRLDQIRESNVNGYIKKRLGDGVCQRTVKLDLIALRNVLNFGIDEGWIKTLPLPRARRNKSKRGCKPEAKRELLTPEDLEGLCEAALATKPDGSPVTKNGQQLSDYCRLMAYSGARRNEALGIRWEDIDFGGRVLHIRRQITRRGIEDPKNGQPRRVNFNSNLEQLLRNMSERRAMDSEWLFPSPQRGEKDIPAKSFRESFELAKRHAVEGHPKLAGVGFHDLRHFFISFAVMSGIDFLSIAEWAGHQDGGVLIGKVYGHLLAGHAEAMGEKLNFGPTIFKVAVNE